MGIRKMMLVPVLLAGTAGPYVAMDDSWQQWAKQQKDTLLAMSPTSSDSLATSAPAGTTPGWSANSANPAMPTTGPAPTRLTRANEVLRFDIGPSWVLQNWPRVSNIRGSDGTHGMRVPLVTGTQLDDLSGSLTYYFDQRQQVKRINFHGYTGDPRKLVQLAMQHLRLQPEPNFGAGMYIQRWNGQPTSALRISHAAVASSANPHSRFVVEMEVNRPGANYRLSQEFQQLLQYDTDTQRW